MRAILILGLVGMVGCSTSNKTATGAVGMEWNTVLTHPDNAPVPVVMADEMELTGRAIRSYRTYTVPLAIECELQSALESSNSIFYVDFVPEDASAAPLLSEYVGIRILGNKTVEAWAARTNQSARLITSMTVPISKGGRYTVAVQLHTEGFAVQVNGREMKVDLPVPYYRFRVQLRSFPPPSSWRLRNFSVR